MKIQVRNILWFGILFISGCNFNPNKSRIESCLNTDLKDNPACELSYFEDPEYPCESSTLFRINSNEKYYHELVSKIGLIPLDKKDQYRDRLNPYDQDYNSTLWMTQVIYQYDRRKKLSWWKDIDRASLPKNDLAANYYYKNDGLITIGDKNKIGGVIIMYYSDSAIFGIINTGCTESINR